MGDKYITFSQQNILDALRTFAIVLVAPTLFFAIVGAFLFLQRPLVNIDYFLLFLLLFPLSSRWAITALCALLCLDLVFALAPAFHFSLTSVLKSTADLFSLNLAYVLTEAGKVLGVVLVFGYLTNRVAQSIRNIRTVLLTCVLLTVGTISLDQFLPLGTTHIERMPLANPNIAASTINDIRIAVQTATERGENAATASPALSAASAAGLWSPDVANAHVVLIVVESLGQPVSEEMQAFQWEEIDALDALNSVHVQRGTVPFSGSTVPGELRELCGVHLHSVHPAPADVAELNCIPEHLAMAGFATTGIHGFSGMLFSRNRWYPSLAFDQILFAPELKMNAELTRRCGLAFRGACDDEVWAYIAREILAQTETRQFVYWLTLTAHLPTEPAMAEELQLCGTVDELRTSPAACALLIHHDRLFDALARSIRDGSIRDTRILLVGDHAPPFLKSDTRIRFDPTTVPYALIEVN